ARIGVISVVPILAIPRVGERESVLDTKTVIGFINVRVLDALPGLGSGRSKVADQSGRVRRRIIPRDLLRERAQLAAGDQIACVGIPNETALTITTRGGWIVDLDQRSIRRLPVREVTVNHLRKRNCLLTGTGGLWEPRSEEHTSELQSLAYLVCRLLL